MTPRTSSKLVATLAQLTQQLKEATGELERAMRARDAAVRDRDTFRKEKVGGKALAQLQVPLSSRKRELAACFIEKLSSVAVARGLHSTGSC